MKNVSKSVFAAMSGGVDSSVAALLLKQKGFAVTGVFIRGFNLDGCAEQEAEDARRAAEQIGIPFYILNLEKEYKERVVDYLIEGYRNGITPNPDVICNKEIKFGLFLKEALEMGADYVATGHYVRLKQIKNPAKSEVFEESRIEPKNLGLVPNLKLITDNLNLSNVTVDNFRCRGPAGNQTPETRVPTPSSVQPGPTAYSLYQARDSKKDQSYFLWTLIQEQLKRCLFPIGDYLKPQVREIARRAGLHNADKKDSQGICFLGKITLSDFLKQHLPKKKGEVLTAAGEKIGEHSGAHFYTIGQRHLGVSYQVSSVKQKPFYVSGKDVKNNTVVVAEGSDDPSLFRQEIKLANVNFINLESGIRCQASGISVMARVRYRQPLIPAKLIIRNSRFIIQFEKPVKFVAPGQSAVFYTEDEEMLGGGTIAN